MTDAVNCKQYVAVLIGGNVQTRNLLNKTPALKDMQNTSMLFVFRLRESVAKAAAQGKRMKTVGSRFR
jgi:hypothetical protein